MTIRVLLADDQALVVSTFCMLIDLQEDCDVVGLAANGREAVDLARATHPDVVVMDIRMPVLDGLAATAEICSDVSLRTTKVLVLTTFETDEYVAEAIRAGASGFLGKGIGPEELLAGIRTVAGGDALLLPAATRTLISRFLAAPEAVGPPVRGTDALPELTAREREVVAEVAGGLSNDEIAEKLYVSPLTVRSHVQHAITKLDVRDRAQLVVRAYQSGLVRAARE
ncbi:response regulator transcription factor [Streptomyces sp. NBC_00582]|uniref:response regulator transcription factor n=1 Tax=Streptomyces sp. NBC_00582 TaxID=2975783 RepID=UPI002E7FD6A9|nr:response regulator transcription factor [Streptomyces sp. NBC_00582]WUB67458.1 response regulator transcription factor [Streptomyces sp. NBC_00582]